MLKTRSAPNRGRLVLVCARGKTWGKSWMRKMKLAPKVMFFIMLNVTIILLAVFGFALHQEAYRNRVSVTICMHKNYGNQSGCCASRCLSGRMREQWSDPRVQGLSRP